MSGKGHRPGGWGFINSNQLPLPLTETFVVVISGTPLINFFTIFSFSKDGEEYIVRKRCQAFDEGISNR